MTGTASDLAELLDRLARSSATEGALASGVTMVGAAQDAGLVAVGGEETVAHWIGCLVDDGRLAYRSTSGGSTPLPRGVTWSYGETQIHHHYYLTESGRRDAAETRRLRADNHVLDVIMTERAIASLLRDGPSAIAEPAGALQRALAEDRHPEAIGAAKELVESSCRAALLAGGIAAAPTQGLAALAKSALSLRSSGVELGELQLGLARRLAGVADVLGHLRNEAGTGHGRAAPSLATRADAELAAAVAVMLSRRVLSGLGEAWPQSREESGAPSGQDQAEQRQAEPGSSG